MMKATYAIVDIETTGGNASGSRITEIAILIHNGEKVIDRWETLINPEKEIPLPIFALTGINNEMVRDAPLFDDVAVKIFEMLNGRVFVAHHVNFDYSFVRHQLEQAGFKWTARKLCTVRSARKLHPGLRSYSLGNLCEALSIDLQNRHRAGGDATATAALFTHLLALDTDGEIARMIRKSSPDQRLPANLPPQDFEALPEKPGVYYFYNQARKVIYVGKAVNLKKRVSSHFTGHVLSARRQHFLRDIYGISFEVCATELMALLLECTEIKKLWPVYNTALKRFEPAYGLYHYEARNGYQYLAVGKRAKFQNCLQSFGSQQEAAYVLRDVAVQFGIDHRYCQYGKPIAGEMMVTPNRENLPEVQQHNQQIKAALDFLALEKPSFAIVDKGRSEAEQSCVWIENGNFYGMGYVDREVQVEVLSQLKAHVTPYKSNPYIMQLIHSFALKHPGKILRAN